MDAVQAAKERHAARWRDRGPVWALCEEIGFPFDPRLERVDLFVAFVGELVREVEERRDMAARIAHVTGKPPSEGSAEVLALATAMLKAQGVAELRERASAVHDASWRLNPDDAYPTDHLIDMLSSCASAIRFGLESPCRSRHAADAAQHVWKQVYGVSRFDSLTPAWEKDWARQKLASAILSLLPPPAVSDAPTPPQVEGRERSEHRESHK